MTKLFRRSLVVAAGAVVAVAMMAPFAQAETPASGYSQFSGCPSKKENAAMTGCIRAVISGGNLKMGNKDTPITSPMTLNGGLTETNDIVFNSKGGLTQAKQKVPGGIVGLTGLTWLAEFLGSEALTLYAVAELAGTPNFGETFDMPLKVHLINGTLGNNCYVGSNSNPIMLHLTTLTTSPPGPNKPITGKEFEFSVTEKEVLVGKNGELVDNSFAAPGASGCVLTLFGFIPISINGLVNTASGLPAAAGTNETRQKTEVELVDNSLVYP